MGGLDTRAEERPYWEDMDYNGANRIVKGNLMTGQRAAITIGYYLKHIRDNQLYLEGGYQNFGEYVRAECGLSESTASRHIARMEQFSEGGNSPKLADRYAEYSASQLQEMLYLTDEQREQVTPEMTVKEIREVKNTETQETSDSEIMAMCEWTRITASDDITPAGLKKRLRYAGGYGGTKIKSYEGSRRGVSINKKPEITYTQLSKRIRTLFEADTERDTSPEICVVLSDAETEQPCIEGPCSYEETCDVASEDAVAEVAVELPDLEDAPGPARCITGQSGSGICGAAAYCGQPYDCCAQCSEDCNGRCGWIPKQDADPEPTQITGVKKNPAMESQARLCLSNLQVEIGAKAWPAALASARHLVHYLSLVVGEETLDLEQVREMREKHGGWFSVAERLPEDDDMVLVTCQTKKGVRSVNRAYYDGIFWHGIGSMSGVVAWMPLPDPYQPEESDGEEGEKGRCR